MNFLITGALGHIGSRLIRELPKTFPESQILMIDNMLTQRFCSLFDLPKEGRYKFIEADASEVDLSSMLAKGDVVFNLAAITDAANSFNIKDEVEHVNYNVTVKAAEACSKRGCSMIHLSSTSVYGTQGDIVDENCPEHELQPQSPYAETKLKEERFLKECGKSKGLRFVTCRFGTICGTSPGMRFHTAVNKFCWQAVIGQPLTVWKTALHQKRPYLTLDDAIGAATFIVQNDLFNQELYNVLTDNLTVHTITEIIKEQVPDLKIDLVDAEIMNQLSYEVSRTKFEEKGFQYKGDMRQSIIETIALLKNAGGNLG